MAAILKAKTVVRSGDGSDVYLRSLLNGELGVADYFFVNALKGRMFAAYSVDVSTPTTWTATATVDVTKPAFWLSVPSGKAVIPVHIEMHMEAYGTDAQFEISAQIGTGGSYTSGGTAITPVCTRTDVSNSSGCTVYAGGNTIVTVGSTGKLVRFWRDGLQFAITKTASSATVAAADPYKFVWDAVATNTFCIAGPDSQLAVHQGSNAGTGFVKVIYLEIPSSELP